jgi:histidyl-tRNA synthetase
MSKKNKPNRPKARLPRGFVDREAQDIRAVEAMCAKIKQVYELYGFDPVETPLFEYTDALGKFLPDSDRPNEGVFSLQDDDEQWLSLRYDLTAPLARHVAQNINDIQLPYRTYRAGYVFRNEKPGPGRFRQFMQFDADTVGAPNVTADAEMCMMMADTMEALGIKRGDYVVRVNNRKVLDGVMEAIGVTEDGQKLAVLRALDKYDRLGTEGVKDLLTLGRTDASGDFTAGAGITDFNAHTLVNLLFANRSQNASDYYDWEDDRPVDDMRLTGDWQGSFWDNLKVIENLEHGLLQSTALLEGLEELRLIVMICEATGYGSLRVVFDPSVVRGLEYYTGPVYECELLFDVTNEKGETVQFGSVAGGGRYDGLVERFTGQTVPATGFSIGVSRLMTALKNLGKLDTQAVQAPVVVCIMDRDADSLGRYQKLVQTLRSAGVRAELFQGNPKQFGKQLQYADRRGSAVAVIQGGDERANDQVTLKDLIAGREAAKDIADRADWVEQRPAQVTVAEADLVAEVQKILAQYEG